MLFDKRKFLQAALLSAFRVFQLLNDYLVFDPIFYGRHKWSTFLVLHSIDRYLGLADDN